MNPGLRLALAGPMGAGKTTLGRLFAERHGVPFVDLDAAIGDIPAIWAREGEAGFRRRERAVLAEKARGVGVLSLGGGTLVDPQNREALREWRIIVLMAPLDVLASRVRGGEGRPLAAQLARLLEERTPVWQAAGPWLWTDGRAPEALLEPLEALCGSP